MSLTLTTHSWHQFLHKLCFATHTQKVPHHKPQTHWLKIESQHEPQVSWAAHACQSQLQVGQEALLVQNGLNVGKCSDLTLGHLLFYSPVRQPRLVIKAIKEQQ